MSRNHSTVTTRSRSAGWIRTLSVPIILFWFAVTAAASLLVPQLEIVGKNVPYRYHHKTRHP